jgi:hypothetical protein
MASQPRRQARKDHPAVQTLVAFITAMNEWEHAVIARDFKRMSDLKTRGKQLLDRLAEIYREFCEPGAQPERLSEMNWGLDQPDYNPATEKDRRREGGPCQGRGRDVHGMGRDEDAIRVGQEGNRWCLRDHRKCYDPDVRKWCYSQL